MPDLGHVYWRQHPTNANHPNGAQSDAGEGELLGFAGDDMGYPCGIVETTDGRFVLIRVAVMGRQPPEKMSDEGPERVFQTEEQRLGGRT